MSKFCPKCNGLVPNPNMVVCPNCGADISNVTEDVLEIETLVNNMTNNNSNNVPSQQPMVDNQPKLDPNLNFVNSSIFKESGNSVNNNNNNSNSNIRLNSQPPINGTYFNQNFNNTNNQPINNNYMGNGYNQMNNQAMINNQNMMNNQTVASSQPVINNKNMVNQGMFNSQLGVNNAYNQKKSTKLKSIILGCSLLLVVLVIGIVYFVVSSGPKSVAQKYYSGLRNFNVSKVVSTYPKPMRSDIRDELEDSLPEMKDYYDEMDIKIKKIVVSSDYEKIKKSEITYTLEYLDREYDISKSSIKELRRYDVTTTTVVDGEEKETEGKILLGKIGMKWYVLN